MLNFISKFLVPQKIADYISAAKDFLRGKKTYLAATIILLQAILSFVDQTLALNSVSALFEWVKGLASNDATMHLAEALAVFGVRAAISSKTTEKAE